MVSFIFLICVKRLWWPNYWYRVFSKEFPDLAWTRIHAWTLSWWCCATSKFRKHFAGRKINWLCNLLRFQHWRFIHWLYFGCGLIFWKWSFWNDFHQYNIYLAGDSLTFDNEMKFTTFDVDNDIRNG